MSSYKIMLAVLVISTMSVIFNYSIRMAFGQELEMEAEFIRQENEFLYDDIVYDMVTFNFTTNDNRICPSNTCTYIFEDGQLSPDLITGQYAVDGELNVDDMLGGGNRTANISGGTIGIGGNALFDPIYKYQVINGTLDFGESTL